MDKETSDILRGNQTVEELLRHDGWKIVESKLIEKIMDLQSILNVTGETAEQMSIDLKSRKVAIQVLTEWLQEIKGMAEESKYVTPKVKREIFIHRG